MLGTIEINGYFINGDPSDLPYNSLQLEPHSGALYIDLLIINDDLVFAGANEPVLIADKWSVLQDIKHLIRESGLLIRCIAERNSDVIAGLMAQLSLLIEADERLIPGTVEIVRKSNELFFISADSIDFGKVGFEATVL